MSFRLAAAAAAVSRQSRQQQKGFKAIVWVTIR